jgi:hypothetical protein
MTFRLAGEMPGCPLFRAKRSVGAGREVAIERNDSRCRCRRPGTANEDDWSASTRATCVCDLPRLALANWLKTMLVQCALAAAKKKGSYLQAQFQRIKARRGPKKAIMAVVASILTAIYHMLKDGTMYHDLGCDHFKRHSTDQQKRHLVKTLVRARLCRRTQAPRRMSLWRCRELVARS